MHIRRHVLELQVVIWQCENNSWLFLQNRIQWTVSRYRQYPIIGILDGKNYLEAFQPTNHKTIDTIVAALLLVQLSFPYQFVS